MGGREGGMLIRQFGIVSEATSHPFSCYETGPILLVRPDQSDGSPMSGDACFLQKPDPSRVASQIKIADYCGGKVASSV